MKGPKRSRGPKAGADGVAKPPKFPYRYSSGDHEISHAQARRLRKRALETYGRTGIGAAHGYHREIFEKILADPRCVGIRIYPGVDGDGQFVLVFCGFDSKGNNILVGTIGDTPFRCPPFCPAVKDGILAF